MSSYSPLQFHSSLEEQLKEAEAATRCVPPQPEVSEQIYATIFASLQSAARPPHMQDLLTVQRSYVRHMPPESLPLSFLHQLIACSTHLRAVFTDMHRYGIRASLETVDVMMAACARLRSMEDVMRALVWVRDDCQHLDIGLQQYNGWLQLFSRGGDLHGAMFVYDEMVRHGHRGDEATFQHLLHACGKAELLNIGVSLLDHIKTNAILAPQPPPSDAIPTPEAADAIEAADTQLNGAADQLEAPSSSSSSLAIVSAAAALPAPSVESSSEVSYAVPGSLFETFLLALLSSPVDSSFDCLSAGLSVLKLMQTYAASGLSPAPTLRIFSALITAHRRRNWQHRAYELYIEMRRSGLLLPTEEFNALMTAIGSVGRGEEGVRQALGMMKDRIEAFRLGGCEPVDVGSFNTLLELCRHRERLDVVTAVLDQMQQLDVHRGPRHSQPPHRSVRQRGRAAAGAGCLPRPAAIRLTARRADLQPCACCCRRRPRAHRLYPVRPARRCRSADREDLDAGADGGREAGYDGPLAAALLQLS